MGVIVMSNTVLEELEKIIQFNLYLALIPIKAENFIFEKRVRLNCFTALNMIQNGLVLREFQNWIMK